MNAIRLYLIVMLCGTFSNALYAQTKTKVVVLPPYDVIAGEGISPNIHQYMVEALQNEKELEILTFENNKNIRNVNYYMIYDKKYCSEIVKAVNPDVVIISKLDQSTRTGNMNTDKWNIQIKFYYPKINKQVNAMHWQGLTAGELEKKIKSPELNLKQEFIKLKE